MARLLHTSDTHLGHQQYPRTDPDSGLNQRETDHYKAFQATIDAAIADPPDVFLHAGDLFDGVRPSNRALSVALDGFLRLSRAGIPTVLIAGNHEHPRMRETGSPFRLFEHLENVHPVYKGRRETVDVGGLRIHAVPQCADNATLRAEVQAIEADPDRHDVLLLHGAIHSIPAFQHAEFNELSLDPAWFDDRFAYVALGHYHGTTEVSPRAWYCGAPDRVSLREAGEEKGYLDVTLPAPGQGDGPDVVFRPLEGRPYMDLPRIDCDGLDAGDILAAAEKALQRVPDGAIARLRLIDLDPNLRGTLDQRAIRAAAAHALHLDLRLEWDDSDHRVRGSVDLRGLGEEFEAYAAQHPVEGLDRERLLGMARQVLGAAGGDG